MKNPLVRRMNVIGKVCKIITLVVIILAIIASVAVAACAVVMTVLPKDTVTADISAQAASRSQKALAGCYIERPVLNIIFFKILPPRSVVDIIILSACVSVIIDTPDKALLCHYGYDTVRIFRI